MKKMFYKNGIKGSFLVMIPALWTLVFQENLALCLCLLLFFFVKTFLVFHL